MKKNIVIIHYNTPYLTECLVKSINLFMKDAVIYIFDNSDKDPFTAKFDNITIIDNTKGQIIDFDKWLEKYPRRTKSGGRVNKWGSAKHCYTVEKCMEIIDDNFILLDSDTLIKRDLSELFDESYIYIAETSLQPHSTINRILPYMCYINVKMCKENNVHFFDDDYMHGLANDVNNKHSDWYDTGSGFYIHASKYNHKDIKLDNYIEHYGHGSWKKMGFRYVLTPEEWLIKNKRLWSFKQSKKVVYTCIVGNYDRLLEPKYVNENFDYVCFTDNEHLSSNIWDIRPLPSECDELPQIKKQRLVKINPHIFLPEYNLSIWVDGNVTIKGDLNKLLDKVLTDDCFVYVPKHPQRDCIYRESEVVVKMRKDTIENVKPQIERYKEEGFPKNYGLLQSNILIRKHNEYDCIKLMEKWSDEVIKGSHRDQLSFNYAAWKNNYVKIKYLDRLIYKSTWFHWDGRHTKSKYVNSSSTKISSAKRIEELKRNFENILNNHKKICTQQTGLY